MTRVAPLTRAFSNISQNYNFALFEILLSLKLACFGNSLEKCIELEFFLFQSNNKQQGRVGVEGLEPIVSVDQMSTVKH